MSPSLSNCSFSGVFTLSSICAAWNTLPFSVLSPTANTRPMPCPSITLVPLITLSVGNVASLSESAGSTDLWHVGSPVSEDSSTFSDTDCSSWMSAGISSPVSMNTRSPTTTSLRCMVVGWPSRTTFTCCSSFTWLSRLNSRSAFSSKMNAMPVARTMAMRMPIGSKNTPMPLSLSSPIHP